MKYKYYDVKTGVKRAKTKLAIAVSALALGVGGIFGAVAIFGTAHADSTVIVNPANTQGWYSADTRGSGAISYVHDTSSPLPTGALELTTTASNTDKAQYLHDTSTPLSAVTAVEYDTKQVSAPAYGDASYQLVVCLNGVATCGDTTGYTTLVYEPYWQNSENPDAAPVVSDTWQTWNALNGSWWSSKTYSDGANCSVTNGAGGPPFYSISSLAVDCPNAVVVGFGVNVGSYNPSYIVETDGVVFNDTTYNFEQVTASGNITSPASDGEIVSGTIVLGATYNDGDVPNNDDGMQWAVRAGTCDAGTGTVAGNVDGYQDAASWDGNTFSYSLDTTSLADGNYCFVFNPTDDPGQPNIRLTRTFTVNNTPDNKDQCMNGGWETFYSPSFRNQGLCVSWVEHNVLGNGTPADNKPGL